MYILEINVKRVRKNEGVRAEISAGRMRKAEIEKMQEQSKWHSVV